MCAFKVKIKNPRYKPNKKNGGIPPTCTDGRKEFIEIECGTCIDCRKKRTNNWKMRMYEELRNVPEGHEAKFVTLTFSEEWITRLEAETTSKDANQIAKLAIKYFRERWRWYYKKSPRHWLITELGHENTERLHIHGVLIIPKGIVLDDKIIKKDKFGNATVLNSKRLDQIWKYGRTTHGAYCNERSITYIAKYITKEDLDHPGFKGKILVSPGLGKQYTENEHVRNYHRFENKADKTIKTYKFTNGHATNLCAYYINKLYTEEQRDKLWTFQLNKNVKYFKRDTYKPTKFEYPIYLNSYSEEIEGWEYYDNWQEYEEVLEERRKYLNRIGLGACKQRYYECRYGKEIQRKEASLRS